MNMTQGMIKQDGGSLGVPPSQMRPGSRFPLQVFGGFVPQPPVGFPLQSLTRITRVESMMLDLYIRVLIVMVASVRIIRF
jgi:hypothetical protein